jgi:TLC domain
MEWLIRHSDRQQQHAERISAVWTLQQSNNTNNNSHHPSSDGLFLPSSFVWNHVIPCIVITFTAVSILYYVLLRYFPTILNFILYMYPPQSQSPPIEAAEEQSNHHEHHHYENSNGNSQVTPMQSPSSSPAFTFSKAERQKLCYQLTNFIVNTGMSCLGLYYELVNHSHHSMSHASLSPQLPLSNGIPVEETIMGYNAFVYISAAQIGYQLWSIPIGICLIHESIPMIIHHITVIACASMSGFLHYGFRYYTPFFYGIVEISSIPLAIMNAFKDHPKTLQQYYPRTNAMIRYTFAALFLYIRIVLFIPKKYNFLRDHILLWTSIHQRYQTNNNNSNHSGMESLSRDDRATIVFYQCFMALVSFSAFFLLLLQIYWAWLIIKGIIKLFVRPKHMAKETHDTNKIKTT